NRYHIFANGKFDMTIARAVLGVESYAAPVYDILGGAMAIDENMRCLSSVLGDWYYSLGNLMEQHGCTVYSDLTFSKSDRANFSQADLTGDVVRYTTFDVVGPIAIHLQQLKFAAM